MAGYFEFGPQHSRYSLFDITRSNKTDSCEIDRLTLFGYLVIRLLGCLVISWCDCRYRRSSGCLAVDQVNDGYHQQHISLSTRQLEVKIDLSGPWLIINLSTIMTRTYF